VSDRKLSIKAERLTELTTDELHRVQGGADTPTILALCGTGTLHGCTTAITCPVPQQ
jgi:hypothetical protein